MQTSAPICFFFGLLLCTFPVRTQDVNLQHPPEIHTGQVSPVEAMKARMNNAQLQKDSGKLSELCASIPAEMDEIKRGLLPKDVLEKLKQIEKLSKRVREELTP